MARPIARDHDEKRAAILGTAARVFADQGIARASMTSVAQACGISKANIYHYYPGKDALLFDILDSYLSTLRDRVIGLDLAGLTAPERLMAIVTETLLAYDGMDHQHKIQTEGIAALGAGQQAILKSYQREMVRQLGDVLSGAAPDVFAGDPRKLRAAVMSVYGMLNWFYMWNGSADRQARLDYAALVTRLTLQGLPGI